jgi:hypothetical protein
MMPSATGAVGPGGQRRKVRPGEAGFYYGKKSAMSGLSRRTGVFATPEMIA